MDRDFDFLKKQNYILLYLLKISLLLVFLKSLFVWFLWELSPYIVGSISIFFCVLYRIGRPSSFQLKKGNLIAILLLMLVEIYCVRSSNIKGYIGVLLMIMPIIFVLLLKDKIKIDLLRFLTSSIALFLFVSLCGWILFLAGVPLSFSVVNFNNGQYWYNNYYLFLYNLSPFALIPRFSGIFLEPGHLGMITSFLLYANHFDLKRKEVLALLVATIFTFSLAAYILLIISVSVFLFFKSKRPLLYIALWFVIIIVGYNFFTLFNNGDNLVNNLVIDRLQIVDGDLAGNNRFSRSMDSYFDNFLKSDDVYTGIGTTRYADLKLGANAGYKVFLVQYGIIGTALLFLFYLSLVFQYRTELSVLFFVVYILSFLQASYALWGCELLIFITALPAFNSLQIKRINGK